MVQCIIIRQTNLRLNRRRRRRATTCNFKVFLHIYVRNVHNQKWETEGTQHLYKHRLVPPRGNRTKSNPYSAQCYASTSIERAKEGEQHKTSNVLFTYIMHCVWFDFLIILSYCEEFSSFWEFEGFFSFRVAFGGFFSSFVCETCFWLSTASQSCSIVGEPVSSAVHTNEHPLLMHHACDDHSLRGVRHRTTKNSSCTSRSDGW